jgi:uncharacterized membrane protein YoaK (UPF0700 family)
VAVPSPLTSRQTVAALLTLTAVTGLVDAVSYLRLGHVFVANMTGNVVFLGFSTNPHSGLSPAAAVIAIAGFMAGALAGGRAAHSLAAARPGRWLATAVAGEALILGLAAALTGAGVLPFAGDGRFATIAVLASALGVQNSTVRHLGAPDLTTTVLTLTLTGLAADSTLAGGPGAKPHRRLGSVASHARRRGRRGKHPAVVPGRGHLDRGRPGRRRRRRLLHRHPGHQAAWWAARPAVTAAGQGTTVTGHRPARTSRTASDPTKR